MRDKLVKRISELSLHLGGVLAFLGLVAGCSCVPQVNEKPPPSEAQNSPAQPSPRLPTEEQAQESEAPQKTANENDPMAVPPASEPSPANPATASEDTPTKKAEPTKDGNPDPPGSTPPAPSGKGPAGPPPSPQGATASKRGKQQDPTVDYQRAVALRRQAEAAAERGRPAEAFAKGLEAWQLARRHPDDPRCQELCRALDPLLTIWGERASAEGGRSGGLLAPGPIKVQ